MASVLRNSTNAAPIQTLPQELLDIVFSQLDSHRDLVHLALTAHFFKQHLIPRHTDYRVLRIRHRLPGLWAHLAKRADLARTVKAVHFRQRDDQSLPDRYPKNFPPSPTYTFDTEGNDEDYRIRDMCTALSHMTHLHTFTWSSPLDVVDPSKGPTLTAQQEMSIFHALRTNHPELRTVSLSGKFAHRQLPPQLDRRQPTMNPVSSHSSVSRAFHLLTQYFHSSSPSQISVHSS